MAGRRLFVNFISSFDHWLAFGLLGLSAVKNGLGSFHPEKEEKTIDITKGWLLLTLSVATASMH